MDWKRRSWRSPQRLGIVAYAMFAKKDWAKTCRNTEQAISKPALAVLGGRAWNNYVVVGKAQFPSRTPQLDYILEMELGIDGQKCRQLIKTWGVLFFGHESRVQAGGGVNIRWPPGGRRGPGSRTAVGGLTAGGGPPPALGG